jgi:hypothetical protein
MPQLSRFSPCTPLDVPGTYNPNDFSSVDLNATFNPAASPSLRRPLFHGGSSHGVLDGMPLGTDNIMADIINGGLPPFYSQDEAEAYTGNDDSQEPWENEAYVYAEEEGPVEPWENEAYALSKGKFDPDTAPALASDGHPMGAKRAKALRNVVAGIEKLHNSIMACMADAASHAAERAE